LRLSCQLLEGGYALIGMPGSAQSRFGTLIYTATAGAQGTLGAGGNSPCSNDPVCADARPTTVADRCALEGASENVCEPRDEQAAVYLRYVWLNRRPRLATSGSDDGQTHATLDMFFVLRS
jgi:hypothetical protein